jgi:hypothetical protein
VLRRALPLLFLGSLFIRTTSAAPSWDGTWAGGWENGDGIQIIIAGNKVIGVYRGGDYPEILSSAVSPEGRMLTFSWVGGDAFLERASDHDREATISLRERGRAVRSFAIQRE